MRAFGLVLLAACATPPPAQAVTVPSSTPTAPPAASATSAAKPKCAVPQPTRPESWNGALAHLRAPAAYRAHVEAGNQTALSGSAVAFAYYMNAMHNRLHLIFSDGYLRSLDKEAKTDANVVARVEIVLDGSGAIDDLGIVKSSGEPMFDAVVVESVLCAEPFGVPPAAIMSPDGKVYFHWEFGRDDVLACSPMHARPFLLRPD